MFLNFKSYAPFSKQLYHKKMLRAAKFIVGTAAVTGAVLFFPKGAPSAPAGVEPYK
jgi:hypothetical protein